MIVRLQHVFIVARLAAVRKQGYRFCSRSVEVDAQAVPVACSGSRVSRTKPSQGLPSIFRGGSIPGTLRAIV